MHRPTYRYPHYFAEAETHAIEGSLDVASISGKEWNFTSIESLSLSLSGDDVMAKNKRASPSPFPARYSAPIQITSHPLSQSNGGGGG